MILSSDLVANLAETAFGYFKIALPKSILLKNLHLKYWYACSAVWNVMSE